MPQLALFEGSHVPRTAAVQALSRGDLHGAHAQLARLADAAEEAADAARLARSWPRLHPEGGDPVETVQEVFAEAFAERGSPGFLSDSDWFGVYARRVADALDAEPQRPFRGWLGAHFAFAAGETDRARRAAGRIAGSPPAGPAWAEAARLAFALDEATKAREWLHAASLDSPTELAAEPPALAPCGVPALDAAPPLPAFPAPVEDVFDAARALEGLPGPSTRWVAVVGEIDRVLAPPNAGEPGLAEEPAHEHDPPRAFLAALRAARRSRERDRDRSPRHCSDRELRARRRMKRLAPALLDRYLHGLGAALL